MSTSRGNDVPRAKLLAIPTTIGEAKIFVAKVHRKLDAPGSALFAVSVGVQVGSAIVGQPKGRWKDSSDTCEVVRCATFSADEGGRNACSFLYSRCARIAKEMGYAWIITYIRDDEDGWSLKAAGWTCAAYLEPRESEEWGESRDGRTGKLFERELGEVGRFRWEKNLS